MPTEEIVAYIEGYLDALIQVMEDNEENKQTVYWLREVLARIAKRTM